MRYGGGWLGLVFAIGERRCWVGRGKSLRTKYVDLWGLVPSPPQITGRCHFGFGFPNPVGVPKPWASYDSSQARSKGSKVNTLHPPFVAQWMK